MAVRLPLLAGAATTPYAVGIPTAPEPGDVARATEAIGAEPVSWLPVKRGARTAASRWVAGLADGSAVFVKIAFTLDTVAWIRDEHHVYARLGNRSFLPRMRGWHDDGERPVLVLEDLSKARWPPPWDRSSIAAVLACLDEVHAAEPPADLGAVGDRGIAYLEGWREIERDPVPSLGLGLFDADWLAASLPTLRSAAAEAQLGGDALLHVDVRSDNLCLHDGRATLVDWNWAAVGNPAFDIAAWLPSLHAEGGPAPEALMPDGASFAAMLAGFFVWRGSRPPIPEAPHVRPMQVMQARAAVPWAARALGLPSPS